MGHRAETETRAGWLCGAPHSLRFRLTVGMTVALSAILAAFILLHYENQRQRTLSDADAHLAEVSQVIEGSLTHAMLNRDLSELQQIIDDVAGQRNVRAIRLLDASGEVRFASGGQDVGARPDLRDPGCRPCHEEGKPPRTSSVIIRSLAGEQVLRSYRPIHSQPACQTCHDPQADPTGSLLIDYSLSETNARLASDLRLSLIAGLAVIFVAACTASWLLDRLAFGKLERMMQAIRRFGEGDRSARAPVGGQDEVDRLAAAFNRMADGLAAKEAETERLYRELQQQEAARAQLLREVIRAQEEERKRIARELHDELGQTLAALSLGLETALQGIPEAMAAARAQLVHVRDLTMATLGQVHAWIQDLRPSVLDDLGLVPAIRSWAESRLGRLGVEVEVEAECKERLPAELETALYRIIQEAISNIAKHARARHVTIRLYAGGESIIAEVDDDGVGFDPQEFLTPGESMRGLGLMGMRERVTLVGGRLAVSSLPGRGTHIRIEVPWTRDPESGC